MKKRFLDCAASDFEAMTKEELLFAIGAAEGRVLACETIGTVSPLLSDVSNAEFAAAMGADVLLLNIFDVDHPVVQGIPETDPKHLVRAVRRLTGRPVGINLEPVEQEADAPETDDVWAMTDGRKATLANAKKAAEMGVSFILLTGNPGTGVTNKAITETLRAYHAAYGDELILAAGKMHASGVLSEAAENMITKEDIEAFAKAGADIILLPAPGTVPGITTEYVRELVSFAHGLGKLTLTAVGTSQEGADEGTIRQIALMCKMTGTDMHHLGDSGYTGIALPENIQAYSIAVKGRRHTYRRMAMSALR